MTTAQLIVDCTQAYMYRNYPNYTEDVLNNLLYITGFHLSVTVSAMLAWQQQGHPECLSGTFPEKIKKS